MKSLICPIFLANGTVFGFGESANGQLGMGSISPIVLPTMIPTLSNVAYVGCGSYHTLAVLSTKNKSENF